MNSILLQADSSFSWATLIGFGVSLLLAAIGYLFNLRLNRSSARLQLLNQQLAELYGPMYFIITANNIAWKSFTRTLKERNQQLFEDSKAPTEAEIMRWRLWMEEVFMTNNEKLYDIIINKSELFVEDEVPQCILDFLAYTTYFKTVVKRWEQGDFSELFSVMSFPGEELLQYSKQHFTEIKVEQRKLIMSRTRSR